MRQYFHHAAPEIQSRGTELQKVFSVVRIPPTSILRHHKSSKHALGSRSRMALPETLEMLTQLPHSSMYHTIRLPEYRHQIMPVKFAVQHEIPPLQHHHAFSRFRESEENTRTSRASITGTARSSQRRYALLQAHDYKHILF
jgi:hypothetical protein